MKSRLSTLFFHVSFPAAALLFGAGHAFSAGFDQSHALYARVLKDRVRGGLVDYSKLKGDGRLDRYLIQLSSVTRKDFDSWSKDQQLAYLLNLYNATTLKLVVGHYPLQSIKDISRVYEASPWDQPLVRVFDKVITLNDLEGTLRRDFNDPRVHFAMVRAARSSPPLRAEPYMPQKLDSQLEDQGRQFFSSPERNRVDSEHRILYLSPIFHWYKEDFERKSDSVLQFIRPYLPAEGLPQSGLEDYSIKYEVFDWGLNEQKGNPPVRAERKKRARRQR